MNLYRIIATTPDRTTGSGRAMITQVGRSITCVTGLTYAKALDVKSQLQSRKFTVLQQLCPTLGKEQIETIISNAASFTVEQQGAPAQ